MGICVMLSLRASVLLCICYAGLGHSHAVPLIINTWPFLTATTEAWKTLTAPNPQRTAALDAVEKGCSTCEAQQCDFTVGFGGSPDEGGETTLDAMIMSGEDMNVGSVCDLRQVKEAIATARAVMVHTTHTTLSGLQATAFALAMGLQATNLSTPASSSAYHTWREARCQPNFRRHVSPKASQSCGPYQPIKEALGEAGFSSANMSSQGTAKASWPSSGNHDTIAMVAIAADGHIAAGASSNGAGHKVPGRIGDACVAGGAAYADDEVGGCGSTGDGDLHLRFQPCYQVVESMRQGISPKLAAEDAIQRIAKHYPAYVGAIFAVDKAGNHAGASHGWVFQYAFQKDGMHEPQVVTVQPISVLRLQVKNTV